MIGLQSQIGFAMNFLKGPETALNKGKSYLVRFRNQCWFSCHPVLQRLGA